ncbi:MAG: rhodanese-like domain-containing protein [Candidatus Promineifilaceae bacterium]
MIYKKLTLSLSLSLLLFFVLVACGGQETVDTSSVVADLSSQTQSVPLEGGGSYTDVSADGLASMLETKDFPLINVHIPYAGEIDGTDEFIPFDQIEENVDKLPADKDTKIVIYCRSGSMSGISARTLVELGYTDVWNLDGGMIAWEASGRPVLYN